MYQIGLQWPLNTGLNKLNLTKFISFFPWILSCKIFIFIHAQNLFILLKQTDELISILKVCFLQDYFFILFFDTCK